MGRPDTRTRILEVAEDLVQRRGFNAFSFQDVADRLGIRKPSLHYHFASKTLLGQALIERHREAAFELLGDPMAADPDGYQSKFECLLRPFTELAASCEKKCLAGVLAAEYESLPDPMRRDIAALVLALERWLERLLDDGRAAGAFRFAGDPGAMARVVIAALEGGLMIARFGDPARRFQDVAAQLRLAVGLGGD